MKHGECLPKSEKFSLNLALSFCATSCSAIGISIAASSACICGCSMLQFRQAGGLALTSHPSSFKRVSQLPRSKGLAVKRDISCACEHGRAGSAQEFLRVLANVPAGKDGISRDKQLGPCADNVLYRIQRHDAIHFDAERQA